MSTMYTVMLARSPGAPPAARSAVSRLASARSNCSTTPLPTICPSGPSAACPARNTRRPPLATTACENPVGGASSAGLIRSMLMPLLVPSDYSPAANRAVQPGAPHPSLLGSRQCWAALVAMPSDPVSPGARACHPVHADAGDVSGWRVVHRREADAGAEVAVGEFLEQLGSAAFGDARSAVNDQVLVQAHGVAYLGFDREHHPAVVTDIAHLTVLEKMSGHDLIAVETDPDHGHLRAAVGVQGHKVSQGR